MGRGGICDGDSDEYIDIYIEYLRRRGGTLGAGREKDPVQLISGPMIFCERTSAGPEAYPP